VIRRVLHAAHLALLAQTRAYFPHVYAGVTAVLVLVFRFAVPAEAVALFFPVFLFAEPGMLGVNLVAAQRYLEKEEGSLAALLTTPLRPQEYLAGLVLASALVATASGCVAFALVLGPDARVLLLAPALFAFSLLSGLLGFALSLRYGDFTRFILGQIPFVVLWQLPLLGFFHVLPWPAVAWLPSAPAIAVLADLCHPAPTFVTWAIGCSALLALGAAAFAWASRSFTRRIRSAAELA